MKVARGIGHAGSRECGLPGLALRAKATLPGAIEQATPGLGPVDARGCSAADHLCLVQVVQGRQNLQARHQRSRKPREGLQEGRLTPGSVPLIVAIQGKQDAPGAEMLGQIHGEGEHSQIALRQRDVAHPFGIASEIGTESRKVHGLQRRVAVLGEIPCRRPFAPAVALAVINPKGMHGFRLLAKPIQQRGALDPSGEQQ